MSKTWKSCEDAARDLKIIQDFGGAYEAQLKADLSKDPSRNNEEASYKFVDPRTGEEIDIRNEMKPTELDGERKFVGTGRGQLIEEYRQSSKVRSLKNQLRMNRPLGFRNDMIESYFENHKEATDGDASKSSKHAETDTAEHGKIVQERSKRKRNNVLITSLLERAEPNIDKVVNEKSRNKIFRSDGEEKSD